MKNRIIKTELVDWKKLEWLQPYNFKKIKKDTENCFLKLKNSLKNNNFIQPFNVWEDIKNNKIWILDGHHRKKALEELLKEGIEIPDLLPANFIDCKNRQEAAKLVIIYSAYYTLIDKYEFVDFLKIEDLDFNSIKNEFSYTSRYCNEIDFLIKESNIKNIIEKENDTNFDNENELLVKYNDLFLIDNKHYLLFGDATNKNDLDLLIQNKKIDLTLTDPPYCINYKTKKRKPNSTLQSFIDYSQSEAETFLYKFLSILPSDIIIFTFIAKLFQILFKIFDKLNFNLQELLIFEKSRFVFSKEGYNKQFEPVIIANRNNAKIIYNLPCNNSNIFKLKAIIEQKIHPTMKPLELWNKLLLYHTDENFNIFDPFTGSGTTLISCDINNRVFFGIELSGYFIQTILKRYKKYKPNANFQCLNREFDFNLLFKDIEK